MAFRSSGIIAIDLASNRLHLVHGEVSTERVQVYDFAAEDLLISSQEGVAQQLEALIERKKIQSLPAALAISGPEVVHRVLEFPSMPLHELGLVVGRQMRALGGVEGKEVVFDWELIEENDTGGFKQVRVLVAVAPKSQVDEMLRLLGRCRLKPALLTTAPLSLLRCLGLIQGGGAGLRLVLYTGRQQGYLLGVKDGAWSFYREFSSRPLEGSADPLVEEAMKETNRALLYYRQRHPDNGEIGFLLGGGSRLSEFQSRLQREMGVEGEVVRPSSTLDLTPLRERATAFRNLFPSFMIPLGLVAATGKPGINLAPQTAGKPLLKRPTFDLPLDLSFLQRPMLSVAVLVLLLIVNLIVLRTERHYQRLLENRVTSYAEWLPVFRAAEESRALRDNEHLLTQALGSGRSRQESWVVLFKMLSRAVPAELTLQSMNLQRDKEEWLITLKGQVMSPDSYTAQAAFNRFYQALKDSPYLERTELLPLVVSTQAEKVAGTAESSPGEGGPQGVAKVKAEGVEVKKTQIQFEVRGHLKRT